MLKVKTPLEREIARMRGYADAEPLENVVADFTKRAEYQDTVLRGNQPPRHALTQRSSSV